MPRLLVVRLSAMGDVLHALPAVAALRIALPHTHFGWVIEERWSDLVRCAFLSADGRRRPLVDQVHTVNFKAWRHSMKSSRTWRHIFGAIQELRAAHYDAAIDFQGAVRSSLLARMSAARAIYGFAEPRENVASMFYTTAVIAHNQHVIEQNLSLASAVAGHPLSGPRVEFESNSVAGASAPPSAEGFVVLNPGAGWGAKQWPAERYGEVAKRLARQLRIRCLLNVGPGEETLISTARRASEGTAEPIACSPAELINVMRSARLFIGGDTGPMHLAAAMGIPVVAIFGPTDPARTGPFGTRNIVLRHPNSRTTLSHEPSADRAMLEISADDVVNAAMALLKESCE